VISILLRWDGLV